MENNLFNKNKKEMKSACKNKGFTRHNAGFTRHRAGFTRHSAGFTLVEMLISVGIFSIIMIITVGALLIVVDAFQKTRMLRNAMENTSVAMESMVKRIRTGSDYDCNPATPELDNCPPTGSGGGGSSIAFIGPDGVFYVYRWDDSDPDNKKILVCKDSQTCRNSSGPFRSITSPEIQIRNLRFYVTGADDVTGLNDPTEQSKVSITINGFAELPGKTDFDTEFDIQTTVSRRVLDIF